MERTTRNSRRRRFPLTLTAIAGTVIAIPAYFMTSAAPVEEESALVEKTVQAPPPAKVADAAPMTARHDDAMPRAASASAPEPEPEAVMEEAPRPRKAAPHRSRSSAAKSKKKRSSSMALSGDSRAPAAPAEAAAEIAPMDGPGGGRWAESDEIGFVDKDRAGGEGDGYDQQLQSNILTAGRTSDLEDPSSLDDLRQLALSRSPALAQAIRNHKDAGAPPSADQAPEALDIAFVLDTTGSMGDELSYLKVEMRSIAETISNEFPNVAQRYALVVYRDYGDDYVVRHTDFASLDSFVSNLGRQGASGGGDFPEAMDQAMEQTTQLSWSRDAAQMVFLVADAPPHESEYGRFVTSSRRLAGKGVSVYPVGGSGVETVCEYLMRWAARVTGGQYIFLTDHSGVGNSHADPHVDQYQVKTLRDHMLEVIRLELDSDKQPNAPATVSTASVHHHHHHHAPAPTWWDQHGLFILILAGIFAAGFAGDMALHHTRRPQP